MKYYRYTDDAGVDVTVITGGIGNPKLEPILDVKGLNAAAEAKGLNRHNLRQITVRNIDLIALAAPFGLRLTVAQDKGVATQLRAIGSAVGGDTADNVPAYGSEALA